MRRHDLRRVAPAAWQAMLQGRPDLKTIPLVAEWAERNWPVIVRRGMPDDNIGEVPVAIALPPSHGKRRIGFTLPTGTPMTCVPPVYLRDIAKAVPPAWQPAITALLGLGESLGCSPRIFGALLWQHVTGLPYLTEKSDLDLLWYVTHPGAAKTLVDGLQHIDGESSVRLDGELELADGGGVNWRELLQVAGSPETVLVKSLDGVCMCAVSDLFFATPVA